MRLLLIVLAAAALAASPATAAPGRTSEAAAAVRVQSFFKPNAVVHVGDSLSYNVYVYDTVTRKDWPGKVEIAVTLVNGARTLPLPVSAYKSYFFTGKVTLPRSLRGRAVVRANVTAGGRSFSAVSLPFVISGPATAVEIGHTAVRGAGASGTVTGTLARPADTFIYANATSTPSQPLSYSWSVRCRKGTASSTKTGSGSDGGPGTVTGEMVLLKLPVTIAQADSCTFSFSARLSRSGSLTIELLGNRRG